MRFLKNNCKICNIRKINSILATVKIQQTSSKIAQWIKEVYSQAWGYDILQKPCKKKRTNYIKVSPRLHRSVMEVGEATHTYTHKTTRTVNIQNSGNNNNRQEKKIPDPKENMNYEKNDYQ